MFTLITPETVVASSTVGVPGGRQKKQPPCRPWSERENLVRKGEPGQKGERKGEPGQKGRTLLLVKGSVKQKKRIGGYKTLT